MLRRHHQQRLIRILVVETVDVTGPSVEPGLVPELVHFDLLEVVGGSCLGV
jgi:hypothetical protein